MTTSRSRSGAGSRRKGAEGEQAVAGAFREAGWQVRGVQRGAADTGDILASKEWPGGNRAWPDASKPPGIALVLDSKRQERLKLPEWSRQVEAVAQAGEVPAVVYRSSREPWRVSMRLDDLLRLLA